MDWYLLDLILPNARRRTRAVWHRLDPLVGRVRHARPRTLVLAGVVAVLLLTALLLSVRSTPSSDAPTNEFIGFYCPACGGHSRLSHRDFKRLWDKREFASAAGQGTLRFKCANCGKLTAVREP